MPNGMGQETHRFKSGKKISRWEGYKTLIMTVNICNTMVRYLFSMAVELCWNQVVSTKLCF